ncbi:unnamed protein product [Trichobilharzia szidati]|nr:unnamed protein product [Trichobilharzia szidati]
MKGSTGFQYIDRDRLLLAVHIAKRDVKSLSSNDYEDNTSIYEASQNYNVKPVSPSVDNQSDQSLIKVNRNLRRKCKPILSTPRISALKDDSPRIICNSTADTIQQRTSENKMPARSDSPPIRDTDSWTPSRRRALHEPTERQLKNSQESRIRQLQAKMSQYSAALEELQQYYLSDKASPRESIKHSEIVKKPPVKRSINRPKSSSVSGSIIRPKPVILRPRSVHASNTKYPSKIQRSTSFNGIKSKDDHYSVSSIPISSDVDNHYDSKIHSLWKEAVDSLNLNGSDVVLLQPDKSETFREENLQRPVYTSVNNHHSRISPSQPDTNTKESYSTHDSVLCSAMKQLLLQIDEAEIEENEIRRRWANKLTPVSNGSHSLTSYNPPPPVKIQSTCTNHKLDTCSTSHGDFHSQLKYKPFTCPNPSNESIQSSFSKKDAPDSKTESLSIPEDNKSSALSHLPSLILPVKLHRHLLQTKTKRDSQIKNMWFYLGPSTTFNNLPDIPVAHVCEELAKDLIQEAIDELYQTIDHTASELVDELIKAELLPEAPDTSISFDNRCEDDPHCLSTPALFRQSDLIVHEFEAPVLSKNCGEENQNTSNSTSIILEHDSNLSGEQSVDELSNCQSIRNASEIEEEVSEKYTSEFEQDTVS